MQQYEYRVKINVKLFSWMVTVQCRNRNEDISIQPKVVFIINIYCFVFL